MIEVEKKFKLENAFFDRIKSEGTFLSQREFMDVYYDTKDWRYTKQNIWLRRRDRSFELKVSVEQESGIIDRYDEITDPVGILRALNLPISSSLPDALKTHQINPFCSFWTDRRKYQLGEFIIDIDRATFDDLTYSVAEIELLVPDEKGIVDAEKKITTLLESEAIDWKARIPGKLSYYLSKKHPKHYAELVKAKVIKE